MIMQFGASDKSSAAWGPFADIAVPGTFIAGYDWPPHCNVGFNVRSSPLFFDQFSFLAKKNAVSTTMACLALYVIISRYCLSYNGLFFFKRQKLSHPFQQNEWKFAFSVGGTRSGEPQISPSYVKLKEKCSVKDLEVVQTCMSPVGEDSNLLRK